MAETDDITAELAARAAAELPPETTDEAPAQPAPMLPPETARPMVANVWRAVLIRLAPNWLSADIAPEHRITPESIDATADASMAVINRYLPDILEKYPELFMLGACVGAMCLPPLAAGVPRFKPEPKNAPAPEEGN